jgi:Mn-dependent DtxR family transcriptional regulator
MQMEAIQESIQDELLETLAVRYESNPAEFMTLPKHTVDSSVAREAVADLRNEGIVEEQVRGVIRLTPRGYSVFRNRQLRTA